MDVQACFCVVTKFFLFQWFCRHLKISCGNTSSNTLFAQNRFGYSKNFFFSCEEWFWNCHEWRLLVLLVILYPATLLEVFIRSKSFLVESLWFLTESYLQIRNWTDPGVEEDTSERHGDPSRRRSIKGEVLFQTSWAGCGRVIQIGGRNN